MNYYEYGEKIQIYIKHFSQIFKWTFVLMIYVVWRNAMQGLDQCMNWK